MREILGRRRRARAALVRAAETAAAQWHWPVLPGAGVTRGLCGCGREDCPTPGLHPVDPPVLAATIDRRMVRSWWQRRPDAPLLVATGSRVSAVSLPAAAGLRSLIRLERAGVRLGPVVATPRRLTMLVAPYELSELGELLARHDFVPDRLRFHSGGGFVPLPPGVPGLPVRWQRAPRITLGAPWLPLIGRIADTLVEVTGSQEYAGHHGSAGRHRTD